MILTLNQREANDRKYVSGNLLCVVIYNHNGVYYYSAVFVCTFFDNFHGIDEARISLDKFEFTINVYLSYYILFGISGFFNISL